MQLSEKDKQALQEKYKAQRQAMWSGKQSTPQESEEKTQQRQINPHRQKLRTKKRTKVSRTLNRSQVPKEMHLQPVLRKISTTRKKLPNHQRKWKRPHRRLKTLLWRILKNRKRRSKQRKARGYSGKHWSRKEEQAF